jgi:large subunit ribosomal protein L10
MLRGKKDDVIRGLQDSLGRASGALFLDYTGLTVEEANRLRRKLGAEGIDYRVVKNTLLTRAMADTSFAAAAKCLKGTPTGVVFGYEDAVGAARTVKQFVTDCQHLKVKGGVVERTAMTPAQAEALADMPSKGEVQAAVVALAMGPGRMLAGTIVGAGGRIAGTIEALVTKLEGN